VTPRTASGATGEADGAAAGTASAAFAGVAWTIAGADGFIAVSALFAGVAFGAASVADAAFAGACFAVAGLADLSALALVAAGFAAACVAATGFVAALAATGVAATVLAATDLIALDLAADFSAGRLAVVCSTTAPLRAAEFLTAEAARADLEAPTDFASDLAAVLAAVFAAGGAFAAEVFTAAVFAAAAAVRTGVVDLADDFLESLVLATPAVLEDAAETVFAALLPPEGRAAAVTLADFVFSFFLADGIRRALLLRPAVETGRITDLPKPGDVAVSAPGYMI
jgi:hypothetical protein